MTIMRGFPSSTRMWASALLLWALAACSGAPNINDMIPPTTDTRHAVAAAALEQLDAPYRDGATGPDRFDDTGLVRRAYAGTGQTLARDPRTQLEAGKPIELADARTSDLLFFRFGETGQERLRVGLYLKPGEMVMAVAPDLDDGKAQVRLVDIDQDRWSERLVGVIRILP